MVTGPPLGLSGHQRREAFMAERVHAEVVPYRDTTDPIRMAVAGYLAG